MRTDGGGTLNAMLYGAVLVLALPVGVALISPREPRPSWPAAGLWLVVAVPSVLQFRCPAVLTALRRDPDLIRRHHQYWRLLTSFAVQDGGVAGTVFNLAVLAAVATVAVALWGPGRAVLLFVLGQLVFDVAATYLSVNQGAGNSGADFAVVAAMVGLGLRYRPERAVLARAAGVVAGGVLLLVLNDAHGIPVLGGLLLGPLVAWFTGYGPDVWQTRHHDASS
jgi:hypothetical protein